MTKSQQNLAVFLATLVAGVVCLAIGHEVIGAALLTGALGHAAPSPFAKPSEGSEQ
jgi:hypothetical protein